MVGSEFTVNNSTSAKAGSTPPFKSRKIDSEQVADPRQVIGLDDLNSEPENQTSEHIKAADQEKVLIDLSKAPKDLADFINRLKENDALSLDQGDLQSTKKTPLDIIKNALAIFGVFAHGLTTLTAGASVQNPDSFLGKALKFFKPISDSYSKYLSPAPIAINAMKNLGTKDKFFRGIAELTPLTKGLAANVSNLPFFSGFFSGLNAMERHTKEFFEENEHLKPHEVEQDTRIGHLQAKIKNYKVLLKHTVPLMTAKGKAGASFQETLKEKLKHASRVITPLGFGLPFFYGLAFGRGEKLGNPIHKLVRSLRSAVGMLEDTSMLYSPDAEVRKIGGIFSVDSGLGMFVPWTEDKPDLETAGANMSAVSAESANFMYSNKMGREAANNIVKLSRDEYANYQQQANNKEQQPVEGANNSVPFKRQALEVMSQAVKKSVDSSK
jgi:hypothetical protein